MWLILIAKDNKDNIGDFDFVIISGGMISKSRPLETGSLVWRSIRLSIVWVGPKLCHQFVQRRSVTLSIVGGAGPRLCHHFVQRRSIRLSIAGCVCVCVCVGGGALSKTVSEYFLHHLILDPHSDLASALGESSY